MIKKYLSEFKKDSRIGNNVFPAIKQTTRYLIKANWDCFSKRGSRRPTIGYEVGINISNSKHICCFQPWYGVYETNVTVTKIENLLHNGHIMHYKGTFSALIMFVVEPHQETVSDIKDDVWRMYVSYREFNAVIRSF